MTGQQNQIIKILLVFTANMNLGDSILAENDRFLVEKAMAGRNYTIFPYSISSRDIDQIKYVDAVIFGGGIFKAKTEKFWLYIPEILHEAQKCNVPVFFSAIGTEEYYPDDERSVQLKEALNLSCVKGISCRDDIETLTKDYIDNPDIEVSPVCDPAVWCRETYAEALKNEPSKKEVIGLGVVRYDLFADYGNPSITKEYQLEFWKETVQLLEEKGLPWTLFTNGATGDEAFANEVLAYIGHGTKEKAPADAADLVRMISSFRGVIAGRMHSNIVAFALNIPSVGFIWNRKLVFWGKKTGHPERFLPVEKLTAENAVDTLMNILDQPVGPDENMRKPVYEAIVRFVQNHVRVREGRTSETIPLIEEHMEAVCLGGMETRYMQTNTLDAFEYSLENGYTNFHLSVRLTKDGEPVCVDGWNKKTYKLMNLPFEDEEKDAQPALSLEQYRNILYCNRFRAITLRQFLEAFKQKKDTKLQVVMNFGRSGNDPSSKLIRKTLAVISESGVNPSQFAIRTENIDVMKNVRKENRKIRVVYSLPVNEKTTVQEIKESIKKNNLYFKLNGIRDVAVNARYYNEKTAEALKKTGMKVHVFSYRKTGELIQALSLGADYAGSSLYTAKYVRELTE